MKTKRGFSLMEVLLTIGVMGVLAGVITPVFMGVRENTAKNSALTTATAIDTALVAYKQNTRGAESIYNNADDKYGLLKTAGFLNGAPSTIGAAAKDGYIITMPATLSDVTTVTKDGVTVPRD